MGAVAGLGVHIQLVHLLEIPVVLINHAEFGENRHRHLEGIDPPPVVIDVAVDHVVNAFADGNNSIGLRVNQIQVNIGLAAALVVGIAGFVAAAKRPLMCIGPGDSVIIILFLGVESL
jgi:hypothetical protein